MFAQNVPLLPVEKMKGRQNGFRPMRGGGGGERERESAVLIDFHSINKR